MQEDDARQMWTRGSYAVVGDWFSKASRSCLDGMSLTDLRVLDVACGTGAVAIEAARRGAQVTGVDLTPSMLQECARRSAQADVAIELVQGSFTDLGRFTDYDVVSSAFGVIFADDPAAVAAQLYAATRPGGTITIAAWATDGAFGGTFSGLLDLLPEFSNALNRTPWSRTDGLRDLMSGLDVASIDLSRHTVAMPFPSVDQAVKDMRTCSGPWMTLFDVLQARGTSEEGNAIALEHFRSFARPYNGGVAIDADYTIARVVRST